MTPIQPCQSVNGIFFFRFSKHKMAENVETLNNIIEFTYFFLIREIIVLLYCSNEASMQHYSGWLMADSMHIKRIWQTGRARHYTNMTIRRSFPCKQCWVRSSEGHWLCKCVLRQNKILNIKYRWNVCVCKVSVIAVFGLTCELWFSSFWVESQHVSTKTETFPLMISW